MHITDDLGNTIILEKVPEKIISLVPSVTKTVADLGGNDKLIAVTKFCKYPKTAVAALPKVGGPKKVKTGLIKTLNPDLIFAVKEENNKEQIEQLQKEFPVVVFNIKNVDDALNMIKTISVILVTPDTGKKFTEEIRAGLENLSLKKSVKTVYLIWKEPWMAAGTETFISSMMEYAAFENIITGRYPVLQLKDMEQAQIILLPSEPFNFTIKHKNELQHIFPEKTIYQVNGEMFSWYGTMMKEAIKYFEKMTKTY